MSGIPIFTPLVVRLHTALKCMQTRLHGVTESTQRARLEEQVQVLLQPLNFSYSSILSVDVVFISGKKKFARYRNVAQLVSVPVLYTVGRRFESYHSDFADIILTGKETVC